MVRSLESLFERFRRRGDVAALGTVFDRAAPELFRIALHLVRDATVAEDLVQDTFLTAIERRDRYDASRPLVPWLTGILSNHARRSHRAKGRTPDPARLTLRDAHEDGTPTEELSSEVLRALERLDAPYREVVLLHLRHGLGPAEIAVALDRAPGTVRAQLHRGLAKLRDRLAPGLLAGLAPVGGAGGGLELAREMVLSHATTALGAAATTTTTLVGGLVVKKLWMAAAAVVLLAVGAGGVAHVWDADDPAPDAASEARVDPAVGVEPDVVPEDGPALAAQGREDASLRQASRPSPNTPPAKDPWGLGDAWSLHGVVFGPDGKGISGTRVEAAFAWAGGRVRLPAGQSDARGFYALPLQAIAELSAHALRVGKLHVEFSRHGFWTQTETPRHQTLEPGGRNPRLDVQLEVGTSVHGVVLDARGQPCANAFVRAEVEENPPAPGEPVLDDVTNEVYETTTDALGRYRLQLEGVPSAFIVLARGRDGHVISQRTTAPAARIVRMPDLQLAATHAVTGRVITLDGKPLPGVVVMAKHKFEKPELDALHRFLRRYSTWTTTREDGTFHLPLHCGGKVRVILRTFEGWGIGESVEAGATDVVLQTALRVVNVGVQDPAGAPLPGAVVGLSLVQPAAMAGFKIWRQGGPPLAPGVENFGRTDETEASGLRAQVRFVTGAEHALVLAARAEGFIPDVAFLDPVLHGGTDDLVLQLRAKPTALGDVRVQLTLDGVEAPGHQLKVRFSDRRGVFVHEGIVGRDGFVRDVPVGTWHAKVHPGPAADETHRTLVPVAGEVTVTEGDAAGLSLASAYYGGFAITFRHSAKPDATHQAKVLLAVRREGDETAAWSPITAWVENGQHYGTWAATRLGTELAMIRKLEPGRWVLRVVVAGKHIRDVPLVITSRGLTKLDVELAPDR